MIRILDIFAASLGLVITLPFFLIILVICFVDTRAPIFIQTRVGKNKKPFKLIKFRTMAVGTSSIASHLISNSSITKTGSFLRRTKLDELPQLFNILKGDMSLVGPRPNLFNQKELIQERDRLEIYSSRPGITGLAQIKNIDMSTPQLLAKTDKEMLDNFTIKSYFKYIILTLAGNGSGDAVKPKT